ncbi:hypothetical protein EVAR_95028_1 [Eumeta japonica]|uniref:Uncharacterized protein n=1 Tax=Eumeta variegata TaxID=151549 RepID=A0A4C1VUZ8_EUMVA|nr:hypothetical protein EVAR_95028_1 [Eumeta japonica]
MEVLTQRADELCYKIMISQAWVTASLPVTAQLELAASLAVTIFAFNLQFIAVKLVRSLKTTHNPHANAEMVEIGSPRKNTELRDHTENIISLRKNEGPDSHAYIRQYYLSISISAKYVECLGKIGIGIVMSERDMV